MAERPTPDATFKRWKGGVGGVKPTVFYGAPTGFAGMLASPALPARTEVAMRLVSSAGEALPAELGERFKRHFGVDIVDGIGSTEMLHIFLSNRPDRCATAPPAGRCRATPSNCAARTAHPVPTANRATCTSRAHRRP
jgi:benzoate-CoA ligase